MEYFLLLGVLLGVIVLVRNLMVYNFRTKLIDRICEHNIKLIKSTGEGDSTLWEEFELVSYNKQVLMFWMPMVEFYKNTKLEGLV